MLKRKIVRALAAASVALVSVSAQAAWSIMDLGTLGGTYSAATDINNSGQITGYSGIADDPKYQYSSSVAQSGFLYSNGTMTNIGEFGENGQFTNIYRTEGVAINNAGQVLGNGYITLARAPSWNFIYENGERTGVPGVIAHGINDAGAVVGHFSQLHRDSNHIPIGVTSYAFVHENGTTTNLSNTYGVQTAKAINNSGQIVGETQSGHAYILSNGSVTSLRGGSIGNFSYANDVNNAGHMVGSATDTQLYDSVRRAFLYMDGQLTDLHTLGGFSSSDALRINNVGQVLGSASTGGDHFSFLYQNGSFTNLSALPEVAAAGWSDIRAAGLNDIGQIVGSGLFNGERRAFVMASFAAPEIDGANGILGLAILGGMLSFLRRKTPAASPA